MHLCEVFEPPIRTIPDLFTKSFGVAALVSRLGERRAILRGSGCTKRGRWVTVRGVCDRRGPHVIPEVGLVLWVRAGGAAFATSNRLGLLWSLR